MTLSSPLLSSQSLKKNPIGIFDSGIGGLTVFRAVSELLPNEDLVYLGDTARVPYGTKSAATVIRYSKQIIEFLLTQKVKLVVVACNTASAFALETLQRHFHLPLLGVIRPGAEGALRVSSSARIGVIGTEGTIQSLAYPKLIKKLRPESHVLGQACPLFVPLVEEGRWSGEITEMVAREYLNPLLRQNIDALILGCTHYPLLRKTLQKVVGKKVSLIDSARETAREVAVLLDQKDLRRETPSKQAVYQFYTTDSPDRFKRVGEMFLGSTLSRIQHIEL